MQQPLQLQEPVLPLQGAGQGPLVQGQATLYQFLHHITPGCLQVTEQLQAARHMQLHAHVMGREGGRA